MSEEKKSRSLQEIQSDYQNLCVKAGHIQYQISVMSEDLALVNKTLKDLNFEGAAAQAKAAAEAPKPEEATAPAAEESKS